MKCGTGGLLGAYSVSKDPELLAHAATAADSLLDCAAQWSTDPLPMPTGRLAPHGQPLRQMFARLLDKITRRVTVGNEATVSGSASLAGAGSFTLEMRYLSRETGEPRYAAFAESVYWEMVRQDRERYGDAKTRANVFEPDWRDDDDDDDDGTIFD